MIETIVTGNKVMTNVITRWGRRKVVRTVKKVWDNGWIEVKLDGDNWFILRSGEFRKVCK